MYSLEIKYCLTTCILQIYILIFSIQLEKGQKIKLPHSWIHALATKL